MSHTIQSFIVLLGRCLLVAPPVVAQPLALGSRVRITSDAYQLDRAIGYVRASTQDTLLVALDAQGPGRALAFDRIRSLEISEGYHRRTLRGLAIGSLVGVAFGLVVGLAEADDTGGWVTGGGSVALGVGLFGGAGAVLGLAVGTIVRTEAWSPVAF